MNCPLQLRSDPGVGIPIQIGSVQPRSVSQSIYLRRLHIVQLEDQMLSMQNRTLKFLAYVLVENTRIHCLGLCRIPANKDFTLLIILKNHVVVPPRLH